MPQFHGASTLGRADEDDLSRSQRGKVVLVVEDDPLILESTLENLHDLGYRTLRAGDAMEALSLLHSGEAIDALFSDIVMPGGINGVELVVHARRIRPGLPVALTSGYSAATVGRMPVDVPLLAKPYLQADLAHLLRQILFD